MCFMHEPFSAPVKSQSLLKGTHCVAVTTTQTIVKIISNTAVPYTAYLNDGCKAAKVLQSILDHHWSTDVAVL